jgi:hypothetical protein
MTRHGMAETVVGRKCEVALDMRETLKVIVGKEGEEFMVPKQVLVRRAPFFAAAMVRDPQGADLWLVLLPHCEPDIMQGYLQWVYPSEICFRTELPAQPCELVKLWTLGDFLGDDHFCHAVMNVLIRHERLAGPDAITHLYNHTSPGSVLRLNIFGMWATRYSIASVSNLFLQEPGHPRDFVVGLLAHLVHFGRIVDRGVPPPQPAPAPRAQELTYHE